MKKKSVWFLMVLISIVGITLGSCSKDRVENEDENLGASRPNPSMLTDLSRPGAIINGTLWEGDNFKSKMTLEFKNIECIYTVDGRIIKYSYAFSFPTVTLTSKDEEKEVIIGTIISYPFKVEDITFVNSNNEIVWMKMTRKS